MAVGPTEVVGRVYFAICCASTKLVQSILNQKGLIRAIAV